MKSDKKFSALILILSIVTMLLSACNGSKTETPVVETPTQHPIVLTATALANEASNPQPQQTPGEVIQTLDPAAVPSSVEADILLWIPAGTQAGEAAGLEEQLTQFVQTRAMTFERVENINPAEINEKVKLVVSLAASAEVQNAAEAAPQVQFLALEAGAGASGANIHSLSQTTVSTEQKAFLAGYILALITPDYRVGVLYQAGTPEGAKARDGFIVGAQYFCGLCNSRYAPVMYYPKSAEVADPGSQASWQAAADALLANTVQAVYVQPEISSPELIAYLTTKSVRIVAMNGQNGVVAGAENLVGILDEQQAGTDLSPYLDSLMQGVAPQTIPVGISLIGANENLISEGKVRLFERIKETLLQGLINPLPYGQ